MLQDEEIFSKLGNSKSKLIIKNLNKRGIFTVDDFICTDIDKLNFDTYKIKQLKAFKSILRYKYLNEPLDNDKILFREYNKKNRYALNNDMEKLGFGSNGFMDYFEKYMNGKNTIKMEDIIGMLSSDFDFVKDFYVSYYKTKKENDLKNVGRTNNNIHSIKNTLKNEGIFSYKPNEKELLEEFKKYNVYTVSDFINFNIYNMEFNDVNTRVFQNMQNILRYKYLNEELDIENILDKEYSDSMVNRYDIALDGEKLGLGFPFGYYGILIYNNGGYTMMDIISRLPDEFMYMKRFYKDYYEKLQEEKETKVSEKDLLIKKKSELEALLLHRTSLDNKIEKLEKEICNLNTNKTLTRKIVF